MKLQPFLFSIVLLSISTISYSQDKGYYSIGNNREKLEITGDGKPADSFVRAEKGYYHIETNNKKLRKSLGDNTQYRGRTPQVTKGYYSIGNNSEKLRKN